MYIENRRNSLKEKQIQEEYKKKIFFEKPKFPYNRNKTEKERNNEEEINTKKYLNKNNLFETPTKQIKTMRKLLNINSFFEEITNYDSNNNTITNIQEDNNV